MVLRLTICIYLVISLGAALTAKAQQPDIASDQEIFAAYCSGALTTQIGNAPADSQYPETRRRRAQLARYRDYLAAKGILSRQRSLATVQGANLSAERGRLDQLACARQRDGCLDKCIAENNASMPEVAECANICVQSEHRCEPIERCSEANLQFPF